MTSPTTTASPTAIIECVPNFSEGRNQSTISAIADAIRSTAGAQLLDVDAGESTNRTVFTFVGSPDAVVDAAYNAACVGKRLIDMRQHKGEHPRLGAMDVCPFVPVSGATMEDCVLCAGKLGRRLGDELGVSVFLYGFAAELEYRRSVPDIRSGEYEQLPGKLSDPRWLPDFGPAEFNPGFGACMVGARKFLIAYNVNLLGTKEQAHRIALNLREQGRGEGQLGRLKQVQGIGWYLDEANIAQISVNILDFDVTPIHTVYEECKKDACHLQLAITGSQICGLIPLRSLLLAADFYAAKENLLLLEEEQRVRLAVQRLGLSSELGHFDPKKRIIEYMMSPAAAAGELEGELVQLQLQRFVLAVRARTPAPGGGSVSAAVGAMGAALGTMAALLSFGNRRFESLDSQMREILPTLHSTTKDLLPLIDQDTQAFANYMLACKAKQNQQQRLCDCISTPLQLARKVSSLWRCLLQLAPIVNINCKSDLQVGVKCLETAVFGAYCNVCINLQDVQDEEWKHAVQAEADSMMNESEQSCKKVLQLLSDRTE